MNKCFKINKNKNRKMVGSILCERQVFHQLHKSLWPVSQGNSHCNVWELWGRIKMYEKWPGARSVGLTWWTLVQGVLHACGTIFLEHPWEVRSNLYFYRNRGEMERLDGPSSFQVYYSSTQGGRLVWRYMVTLCACPAAPYWRLEHPPAPEDRAAVQLSGPRCSSTDNGNKVDEK